MKIQANQIEPIGDRILVMPDPVGASASGILVPDNAKEKPLTGTVVASGVGSRATLIGDPEARQAVIDKIGDDAFALLSYMFERCAVVKNELQAGDKIMFGMYAGQEVTLEDKTYLILREADVIARISKGAESLK